MNDIHHIIETKLAPPTIHRSIARKNLSVAQLKGLESCKLVLVKAPAGYGKSILLAQWYQQYADCGDLCLWLSLGPEDNEPSRFLRYLAHALEKVKPGVAAEIISYVNSGDSVTLESMQQLIVKLLSASDTRYYLFLDDFHVITNERLLSMLDWLSYFSSDSLRFVIGSRQSLPFSISRLKLQNNYREFGIELLQFSPGECREVITKTSSVCLKADQYSRIAEKTEGWPAAVMLVSMSLDGVDDPDDFIEKISGDDREITEYLGATVMAQLPEEYREFMELISPCERFCAELCDAVVGQGSGRRLLEEISRRNLFVISLDRVGRWYRYHHLFAEFLINAAFIGREDEKQKILVRAAQWHIENGYIDEAIRYALGAQEFSLAAQWVTTHAEEIVQYRGEHSTLLSWVKNIPEAVKDHWPMVRVYNAWSLAFTHNYSAAEHELSAAELFLKKGGGESGVVRDDVQRTVELIRCIMWALRDRAQEARQSSERWMLKWDAAKGFEKSIANATLAYACKCSSEFVHSKECIYTCFSQPKNEQSDYVDAWASIIMTVSLAKQGLHKEAIAECKRAKNEVEGRVGCKTHITHMLSALLAAMMYEINEIDQAKALIKGSLVYVQEQGTADCLIAGYLVKARVLFLEHRDDDAFSVLREGEKYGYIRDFPRVALTLLGEQIVWLLRLNRVDSARDLISQHKNILRPSVDMQEHWQFALSNLLRIRIMIAGGENLELVLGLLSTSIHRAKSLGQGRRVVELLMIKALALAKAGALKEALRELGESLLRAAPQGYVRVFLDEGSAVKNLLVEMVKSGVIRELDIDTDYFDGLLQGFGILLDEKNAIPAMQKHAEVEDANLLRDKLTGKEISILRLLNEGRRNKEMAEILFVTEGTIKWHLHNIYTKLGVRSRVEAVSLARKLTVIY